MCSRSVPPTVRPFLSQSTTPIPRRLSCDFRRFEHTPAALCFPPAGANTHARTHTPTRRLYSVQIPICLPCALGLATRGVAASVAPATLTSSSASTRRRWPRRSSFSFWVCRRAPASLRTHHILCGGHSPEKKWTLTIDAGAGESGKSTILKQMKLIYAQGFSNSEKLEWKPVIFSNIVQSFKTIYDAMTELGIDFSEPENEVRHGQPPRQTNS